MFVNSNYSTPPPPPTPYHNEKEGVTRIYIKIVLLLVIFIVTAILGYVIYRQPYYVTDEGAYLDKLKRLQTLQGQKAVFIGGSATKFGVHTEVFEKETGIPSVNMAVTAGISFKMYIDSVSPYLHEGDFLFICPEYSYYNGDYDPVNENSLNFMFLLDPNVMKFRAADYWLKAIPEILTIGWRNWGSAAQMILRDVLSPDGYGVYYRKYFNEYGDMIGHKDRPNRIINTVYLTYTDKGFLNGLQEDISKLHNNNAHIFLLFQPYQLSSYENSKNAIGQIYHQAMLLDDINSVFTPEQTVYDDDKFYDTVSHLTFETGIDYTNKIISFIKSYNF
jgi:hypothetical protein